MCNECWEMLFTLRRTIAHIPSCPWFSCFECLLYFAGKAGRPLPFFCYTRQCSCKRIWVIFFQNVCNLQGNKVAWSTTPNMLWPPESRKWSGKLEFLAGVLEYTCYKIDCAATSIILPWDKKLQKVRVRKRLRATLTRSGHYFTVTHGQYHQNLNGGISI